MPLGPRILDKLERVIFPQRMSFPIRRQEQATQIRMIVEANAEQIENFALEPVRSRPDAGHAVYTLFGPDF